MPVSSVPAARKRGRLQVAVWRILQWEGPEWSWQVITDADTALGATNGARQEGALSDGRCKCSGCYKRIRWQVSVPVWMAGRDFWRAGDTLHGPQCPTLGREMPSLEYSKSSLNITDRFLELW